MVYISIFLLYLHLTTVKQFDRMGVFLLLNPTYMNNTIYALFETDAYKTKSSRIFLGVYSTETKAIIAFTAFKEDDRAQDGEEMEIVECELNKYGEY